MNAITTDRPKDIAATQGNQVANVAPNQVSQPQHEGSFGEQLKVRESQFKAALPPHVPLDRFMRVVLTAVQRNADLGRADRASLITSAIMAAQDGLLPDGKEGAFVIYKSKVKEGGREFWVDKVQWMVMIGGLRKKVRNSGEIRSWVANVVYQKDHFDFELGDDPFIKHRPYTDGDPGPVRLAYSIATFKSGEKSHEVMTKAQIDKVRAASKSKDSGPWVSWYDEMCRKTVARRHSKVLPMSTDLDDIIRRDDELYDMKGAREQAAIANGGKPQSLANRLEVLANAAGREDAPPVERQAAADTPAHDPDTGEITDQPAADAAGDDLSTTRGSDASSQEDRTAASTRLTPTAKQQPDGAGAKQTASASDDPEKAALMETLRSKAKKGGSAALKRALSGLVPAQNEMLTSEDRIALGDVASEADARSES